MKARSENTRETILDCAQKIILRKGFSGASLDEIIEDAGITKGGFFYHFKGRSEMAKDLLIRYLAEDDRILRELIERAKSYADDPYERVLVFMKLYTETIEQIEGIHPGCLIASYTYEAQQFDPEIKALIKEGVESWKRHYLSLLRPAAEAREICKPFTAEKLADMLNVVIEGGIILTKVTGSNEILIQQMNEYREMLRLVFSNGRSDS